MGPKAGHRAVARKGRSIFTWYQGGHISGGVDTPTRCGGGGWPSPPDLRHGKVERRAAVAPYVAALREVRVST